MKLSNPLVWLFTDDQALSKRFGQLIEAEGLITTVIRKESDLIQRLERAKPCLIVIDLYKDGELAPQKATRLREAGYEGKIALVVPTANFTIRLAASKLLVSAVESRPMNPVLVASIARLSTADHKKTSKSPFALLTRLFKLAA
jgi:DNA-binding NtrC family response regulator